MIEELAKVLNCHVNASEEMQAIVIIDKMMSYIDDADTRRRILYWFTDKYDR